MISQFCAVVESHDAQKGPFYRNMQISKRREPRLTKQVDDLCHGTRYLLLGI